MKTHTHPSGYKRTVAVVVKGRGPCPWCGQVVRGYVFPNSEEHTHYIDVPGPRKAAFIRSLGVKPAEVRR